MEIVCWIILFLLSAWLLVSLFIGAYWFFDPAEWFRDKHKYISAVIGIGAFFCCWIVIGLGVRYLLWFIPKDWTIEAERGDIKDVGFWIACLIGFCATMFLGMLFEKIQKMHRENKDLTREIERRTKELDFFEESLIRGAIAELRQKLKNLEAFRKGVEQCGLYDSEEEDELIPGCKLKHAQEIERRVLLGLLNELECRLESLMELKGGEDESEDVEDEQKQ
jgi:hypothetical protein